MNNNCSNFLKKIDPFKFNLAGKDKIEGKFLVFQFRIYLQSRTIFRPVGRKKVIPFNKI